MTSESSHEGLDPLAAAEAVYFALGTRSDRTESVDIEALCQRHPDLADALRDVHQRWQRFQSAMVFAPAAFEETTPRSEGRPAPGGTESASSQFVGELSQHRPPRSRYQLRGQIAQGGMGAILKVWDEPLKRDLAMKVVLGRQPDGSTPPVDERTLSRFLEEALVTGQLDHPGVVPVHELGVDQDGQVYFTMRLVKGRDLKAIFALVQDERDGWNRTRALSTVLRACEAVAFAHSRGVIHRDLKPANIMVGQFGEVYVMDWGLAKVRDRAEIRDLRLRSSVKEGDSTLSTHRTAGAAQDDGSPLLTMDGTVIGTPAYMSPEQARGELERVDTRSDVYAMGTILYELLTGRPPYALPGEGASPQRTLESILSGPPAAIGELATVPAELEAICEKAMARQPAERYEDIVELAEDLRAYLEHRVVRAYETGALAELRKWVVRNKPLALAVGSVIALLVAGGGVFAWLSGELSTKNVELTNLNTDLDVALVDAREQRALADAHAVEARMNAASALAQAARAEAERANVLRLSAFQQLQDLQHEAELLWPARPALLPVYDAWLLRAEALAAGLQPSADGSDQGHRAQLEVLRQRALPQTKSERQEHPAFAEWEQMRSTIQQTEAGLAAFRQGLGGAEPSAEQAAALARLEATLPAAREHVAGLEREISADRTFRFARADDTWWHNQLTQLIAEIELFSDPAVGLIEGQPEEYGWSIVQRRNFATTIEQRTLTSPDARTRWSEAISSIADRAQCPDYEGLMLTPQLGLLPIGRDPGSGLWEFWHVQSGAEPLRGEDGKLAPTEATGIVLVLIPGGRFWMGSQSEDRGKRNYDPKSFAGESPVHEVALSPYFLSKYEMTQGQWAVFVLRGKSGRRALVYYPTWNRAGRDWSPLHPVTNVSWFECETTLAMLGLVLPTEAQWEYGCRAKTSTVYWSGNDISSLQGVANIADRFSRGRGGEDWAAWEGEDLLDDGETLHAPVGTFRANGFGLHDTHGNVWEWCRDGFIGLTSAAADVLLTDPLTDPSSLNLRVLRSGSYYGTAVSARSANRGSLEPINRIGTTGVRPARSLSP